MVYLTEIKKYHKGHGNMTILNKEVLPKHGPYHELVYRRTPLVIPEDRRSGWPSREMYSDDIFFELSDDLLDELCSFSKQWSPFDRYEFTNFTKTDELFALAGVFLEWATLVTRGEEKDIIDTFSWLVPYENNPDISAMTIQCDLIETMQYLAGTIIEAARNGHTITIIGI
jgi:hypothetical protein